MLGLNEDFRDLLVALFQQKASYLIVGAHAMAVHGVPRATGDLDIWVRPDPDNAKRVLRALVDFGAPVEAMGVTHRDLAVPGVVYQIGLPPRRIDILTEISGIEFDAAWPSRSTQTLEDIEVPFLGRDALLLNKKTSGRAKDLLDIELLEHQAR
ncbi:MAG: hypothetical protein M3O15_02425 [Acidobacteriota bacterium]|nr:hypothetical protein [Acidobacteriota bacterium]